MTIQVDRDSAGIVTVLMNRPEKLNAFTLDMYQQFGKAFSDLDADESVRCIVVRGAGGSFCTGSDIAGFEDERNGGEQAREYAELTLDLTDRLKYSRHPTVACIEGPCIGGGLEIAALCDIRIAGKSARFGIPANRLGLALDYRELTDLVALVGPTATLEILLEGNIFDSQVALQKGLITRITDDDAVADSAYSTAARIAAAAPLVNRWHKKFVRRLSNTKPLTPQELLEPYACFDTEDYQIGQAAFKRKEKPVFLGR